MTTPTSPLGTRVLIWGNSCSGKSTLAHNLATLWGYDFVELDALNWLPNWEGLNATDPDRLKERIAEATAGPSWVVAGSYSAQSQATFWPHLDTIVWLDLPRWLLIRRCIVRCWKRWRTREHLWGTNYENFWDNMKFWRGEDALLWWVVTQHERKRAQTLAYMTDPRWQHIRFIRLTSVEEQAAFEHALRSSAHS